MNNFERIVGTVLMIVVFFGLYLNKDNATTDRREYLENNQT